MGSVILKTVNKKDAIRFILQSSAIEGVYLKEEDIMPEVETASGVKRFPYTKKGKKKAKIYAKRHGISNMHYGK